MNASKESLKAIAASELKTMKMASAFISLRGNDNDTQLSDIPAKKMALYKKYWFEPVHIKERVENTKWVVLIWPTPATAQRFNMSTEAFENYYFNVCTKVDYEKMSQDMDELIEIINKTENVKIIGPGKTALTFSLKGMKAIKCAGKRNIPDGEVYTAPVRDSVNGVIEYNTPTIYEGKTFSNICLSIRNGKIIKAKCGSGDENKLNEIFNTDKGARYFGEFALGLNPQINEVVMNILFDEKVAGSIHLTPGGAYKGTPADNGNVSNIHWDLVMIQTKKYGGGEIYFDNVLIRKDGLFVLSELKNLNP
jgi:aminopeptidase